MIWIPNETEAWEPAQLISADNKSVTVKLKNGKEVKIPGEVAKFDSIPPGSLEEECDNLVNLENFSEGIILHHVRRRFATNEIYTFVGSILIAVNPYKSLDIYDNSLIDKIYTLTKHNGAVPPHVFSIGAAAVYNMRHDNKDQSVLISGESGAGKTEATKKILQFISTVCGSTASRIGASIENQILDSNPLLESFGNAKTMRNNNSSRFGKYMEVNCDKKHNIKGCNVKAYLLEKSRVVKQGPMERNYHVFYMLLAGANKEMKKNFGLKPVDQFYYLSQSGCVEVERRSDLAEYEEMVHAMNSLAIDANLQNTILQCLAAILHLGNLTFAPARDIEGGSRATVPADCRRVATLLGTNPDGLERAMCTRNSTVNGETVVIPLSPDKAVDQRDTLAKYVYGKIFDHIVLRVNTSLYRGKPGVNIGVLDIFGFEVFGVNSFEQLCINYCNERLQTFFNEIIFDGEIKMYAAEGLPCDDISYQDNAGCVRLIDLRGGGIFTYLDEEIVIPKGSDEKFVAKLNQIFDESGATKSVYFTRQRRSPMDFTVRHFAGDVTYHAKDFLEKNKDVLAEALLDQMNLSSIPLLVTPPEVEDKAQAAGPNRKKGSKLTLAAKFKADLDNLMTSLRATVPHFIRCVKPNAEQAPNKFDANLALNQLKYSGLFEAIRIRKSGYAVRMDNVAFVKRYKHVALTIPGDVRADPIRYCNALLDEMNREINYNELAVAYSHGSGKKITPEEVRKQTQYVVGKTRVFIRSAQYKAALEKIRDDKASNCSVPLQKIVRGFIMRNRFVHKIANMRKQGLERRVKEAQERDLMAKEELVSMCVEQVFRSDSALQAKLIAAKTDRIRAEAERKRLLELNAATLIQRRFRGQHTRAIGRVYMCETMFERALHRRDEMMINRAIVMPHLFGVTSKLIKTYTASAKKLIMEVLAEAHCANELREAMLLGSVPLLKDAIRRAEESKMVYLAELRDAKRALSAALHLRSIVTSIETVLVKCVTVPKLLQHADELEQMLEIATDLDLAGEYIVQDAALRLNRVRSLIQLRDRIRFAVETCSPSKMMSTATERAKLLRIYGPELFAEEARAVEGMFRMLNYQNSVDSSMLYSYGTGGGGSGGAVNLDDALSHQDFSSVMRTFSGDTNVEGSAVEGKDILLPTFVRKALQEMLLAADNESLEAARESVIKLEPDETRRRFYTRIFKWVVAYASWKFGGVRASLREGTGAGTTSGAGFNASNTSFSSAAGGNNNNNNMSSPGKYRVTGAMGKAHAPMDQSFMSPGSPAKSVHSPLKSSQHPHLHLSPDKSGPRGSAGSGAEAGATFIPFAQRQAKSQVAAREILKKGQKVHHVDLHAKTDTLLKEQIEEYDRFRSKVQNKSTFRG